MSPFFARKFLGVWRFNLPTSQAPQHSFIQRVGEKMRPLVLSLVLLVLLLASVLATFPALCSFHLKQVQGACCLFQRVPGYRNHNLSWRQKVPDEARHLGDTVTYQLARIS